jgi:transcriptional regulator with XRE-family HTH domain
MNNIGDRLRFLRTSQGLSVEKAAELCGWSAPQIRKIESGYDPKYSNVKALVEAYGSNLSEFHESSVQDMNPKYREAFEELKFILDQADVEEAGQEAKDRAEWILGNIHVFYRDAIRPVGRITRFRRRKSPGGGGGGVEAAKPQIQNKIHGRFKGPTTAGKFPD